jgi:hypothetical protein
MRGGQQLATATGSKDDILLALYTASSGRAPTPPREPLGSPMTRGGNRYPAAARHEAQRSSPRQSDILLVAIFRFAALRSFRIFLVLQIQRTAMDHTTYTAYPQSDGVEHRLELPCMYLTCTLSATIHPMVSPIPPHPSPVRRGWGRHFLPCS